MEDAFATRVVNQGQGRRENRLGGSFVLGVDCRAQFPDLMPEFGAVGASKLGALPGLLNTLQSGLMTCHKLSFSTE
jgi:hypothetical protein